MRLDKFLKVSRIIKRRTVANDACDSGRALINGRQAKAGTQVKVGDVVTMFFGDKEFSFKILQVNENAKKQEVINAKVDTSRFEKLKERKLVEYQKEVAKADELFVEEFVSGAAMRMRRQQYRGG